MNVLAKLFMFASLNYIVLQPELTLTMLVMVDTFVNNIDMVERAW